MSAAEVLAIVMRCLAGICGRDFDLEGRLGVMGSDFLRNTLLSSLSGLFVGEMKALVRTPKSSKFFTVESPEVNW